MAASMSEAKTRSERALGLYVGLMIFFLALPIAIVIPSAFSNDVTLAFPPRGFSMKWFKAALEFAAFRDAFWLSISVAVLSTVISLVAGTLAAIALVRYKPPGHDALLLLFLTPLVFPAIVLAAGLAMVLGSMGLLRTFSGLVMAHVLITLPYVVRTILGTLSEIDPALEEAAATLGANRWKTFRHVTEPLLRPGLLAGATFSLIISFDEFTVSLFLVGPGLRTLPLEIYNYTDANIDPTIAAISTLLIALTLLVVVMIEKTFGFGKLFS